jgi:bromodomain-containing factor 1
MATPPPEGAAVLKEEKPLAAPALNDVTPALSLNRSPDSLLNGKVNTEEKAALNAAAVNANKEAAPALNGQDAAQSPLANGANGKPAVPDSPAPDNDNNGVDNIKVATTKPDPDAKSPKLAPEDATNSPAAAKFEDVESAADDIKPAPDTTGTNHLEVQTSLPHHPTPVKESPSADQEMIDAPLSPAKVSRQREVDSEEEPAAKRTKTNGEDVSPTTTQAPPMADSVQPSPPSPARTMSGEITPLRQKFLVKAITNIKRSNDSRFYREPVDPVKLNIPSYFTVITQPMDLSKIDDKLKKGQYTSVEQVVADVELMTGNAARFNGPDHIVSVEGSRLKGLFQKQLEKLPRPDEVEEKKPKKLPIPKEHLPRRESRIATQPTPKQNNATSPTFALNPEGLPTIRRDSTNPDGRPKRAIHAPKRDLLYSAKPKKRKFQYELKFCKGILSDLYDDKLFLLANPFYYPVDPVALNIPTYHSVIKKPMDLSTVQTKLNAGQYENAKEFEADIRLMFKNCFKFNIPGDPIYQAGQKLEEFFSAKWANKDAWLEENDPDNHQSGSSDDDSEEVESEEDGDQEKLLALQRQIAEMSKQVEAITQKKKKTPPASKKATKSKSGKKDSKKSSKGDKRSKNSKSDKRNVTYHEKQIISNGISTLPDKKMQEALRIIQSNVPALKGTQETEIELDIDELPNEVLLLLLKFVKKNAPQVMEDEDMSAPISSTAVQSKPKKNKPMSKFEQEAQINMLQGSLSRFQGGGAQHSPEPMRSVEADDSSDESDDDSEESEEE